MVNPYDRKLERIKELRDLWERIDRSTSLTVFGLDDRILVKIESLLELSIARRLAKGVYSDWKDKLFQIWNGSSNNMCVSWENVKYPFIEIRLTTTVENFPKELLRENCRIEKKKGEDSYAVVCSVEG